MLSNKVAKLDKLRKTAMNLNFEAPLPSKRKNYDEIHRIILLYTVIQNAKISEKLNLVKTFIMIYGLKEDMLRIKIKQKSDFCDF